MNKKGNNFQIWVEMILFFIVIIVVLGLIGSDMNSRYGQTHDLTLGLNMSSQFDALKVYKTDAMNDSTQGQASLTDFGVFKLLTTPKMLVQAASILWNFVSGNFIRSIVDSMQLGEAGFYLAIVLQILYVLAILFILIKLVLRMPV